MVGQIIESFLEEFFYLFGLQSFIYLLSENIDIINFTRVVDFVLPEETIDLSFLLSIMFIYKLCLIEISSN